MGKILCWGLWLFLAAALYAQNQDDFDTQLTEQDGTAALTITKYRGNPGEVRIPAEINGLPVRAVGNLAFSTVDPGTKEFSGMGITRVEIPETVRVIGDYAFYRNELELVELPEGLLAIGDVAFAGNRLTAIRLPEGLKAIGVEAFAKNKLTELVIPDSVSSVGEQAFAENLLSSVVIPASLAVIENYTFAWNKLTLARIPETVVSIGSGAFAGNALVEIALPETLTSIGMGAFAQNALASVTLPSGLTVIDGAVFARNELTTVAIPPHVKTIGAEAFMGNKIAEVSLPASLREIKDRAFMLNPLRLVMIGDDVELGAEAIGGGFSAFYDKCARTAEVYTYTNGKWNYGAAAFDMHITKEHGLLSITITGYDGTEEELVLPGRIKGMPVAAIADGAFAGKNLTSVSLPAGLKTIGENAFEENPLTRVTIGFSAELADSSFGTAFYRYYYNNGRKAGVYVLRDGAWISDFR